MFLGFVILLGGCSSVKTIVKDRPSNAGLRLWLDASDESTLSISSSGEVTQWKDKSPDGRCAVVAKGHPVLIRNTLNSRLVIRFDGASGFEIPAIRESRGAATIFIVSRRLSEQVSENKWQRLFSCWDGNVDDNKNPNFCVCGTDKGSGAAYDAVVYYVPEAEVAISAMAIGMNRKSKGGFFKGDIAEILLYDRSFLSEDEMRMVADYLAAKWGATLGLSGRGWTRVGHLGTTPHRINDKFPLSDQKNRGRWVRYEPMCDEFNGTVLDAGKWRPSMQYWLGRQPAFFCKDNVTVSNGCLHLKMRKEECDEMQPHKAKGYHTYTSAVMLSHGRVLYGYFEVCARPMKSAGSSSFWFAGMDPKDAEKALKTGQEIDVFEIGGAAVGFERKYNMNAHATTRTPNGKERWNTGGVWLSPWNLADDFHVYGFEWDEKWLQYYVDGVLVRKVENICWHYPLQLIFDSETMPTWFGMPEDKDLPSTFSVQYVRTWQQK